MKPTPIQFSTPKDTVVEKASSSIKQIDDTHIPMTVILPEKEITIKKNVENNTQEEKEWINIRVSYYTISKKDTGKLDGITASGKNLKSLSRGGDINIKYIATPKSVPFGTNFYIEGIGKCEAVDTGSAINWHGNTMWVDVFVPHATQSELKELGVKYTKGYIIK
jgi:3D (Asp-Asp-Asp) domain-containing protein